jgi:NAD dependent epimerase/dehydratase family
MVRDVSAAKQRPGHRVSGSGDSHNNNNNNSNNEAATEMSDDSIAPTARRSRNAGSSGIFGLCNGGAGAARYSHSVVLLVGVMLGYLFLPMLMLDFQMNDYVSQPEFMQKKNKEPPMQVQSMYPGGTDEYAVVGGLRPVAYKQSAVERTLELQGATRGVTDGEKIVGGVADSVEQRLIEDHDVLSRQSLPTRTTPYVMRTATLPDHQRMKILVTGGAGFVGSHLVDKLMMEGHEVTVLDNFFTGQKKNIAHWLHHPNFR